MRRVKIIVVWSCQVTVLLLACGVLAVWLASYSRLFGVRHMSWRALGAFRTKTIWELQTDFCEVVEGRLRIQRSCTAALRSIVSGPDQRVVWYRDHCGPRDRWDLSCASIQDGWCALGFGYMHYRLRPEELPRLEMVPRVAASQDPPPPRMTLAQAVYYRYALTTSEWHMLIPCWSLFAGTSAMALFGFWRLRKAVRKRLRRLRGLCGAAGTTSAPPPTAVRNAARRLRPSPRRASLAIRRRHDRDRTTSSLASAAWHIGHRLAHGGGQRRAADAWGERPVERAGRLILSAGPVLVRPRGRHADVQHQLGRRLGYADRQRRCRPGVSHVQEGIRPVLLHLHLRQR